MRRSGCDGESAAESRRQRDATTSTARHGTARHGTARHGTARHGTAIIPNAFRTNVKGSSRLFPARREQDAGTAASGHFGLFAIPLSDSLPGPPPGEPHARPKYMPTLGKTRTDGQVNGRSARTAVRWLAALLQRRTAPAAHSSTSPLPSHGTNISPVTGIRWDVSMSGLSPSESSGSIDSRVTRAATAGSGTFSPGWAPAFGLPGSLLPMISSQNRHATDPMDTRPTPPSSPCRSHRDSPHPVLVEHPPRQRHGSRRIPSAHGRPQVRGTWGVSDVGSRAYTLPGKRQAAYVVENAWETSQACAWCTPAPRCVWCEGEPAPPSNGTGGGSSTHGDGKPLRTNGLARAALEREGLDRSYTSLGREPGVVPGR